MFICVIEGHHIHCYPVPIIRWPVELIKPSKPENYPYLIGDLTVIASIREVLTNIQDDKAREALNAGIGTALEAIDEHAGEHIRINEKPLTHA